MENIWDKEKKSLYKELVKDYVEEGYDKQEAAHMARAEVEEMFGSDERDAYSIADTLFE